MSISSNGPQQSLTTQDVGVWLLAAAEKHAAIGKFHAPDDSSLKVCASPLMVDVV